MVHTAFSSAAGNEWSTSALSRTAVPPDARAVASGCGYWRGRTSTSRVSPIVCRARAAEAAIVDTLLDAYPDHAILAEEGTAKGKNADAENVWIIDPLDGTTNFLHGFPQYCVSIALQHRGLVTQGVVYDPTRNDLFTATRGPGAFMNERRIRASKRDHLPDTLIATRFPSPDGAH